MRGPLARYLSLNISDTSSDNIALAPVTATRLKLHLTAENVLVAIPRTIQVSFNLPARYNFRVRLIVMTITVISGWSTTQN